MTILTLRRIRCLTQYPGSPIREIGGRKKGIPAAVVATGELAEILERRPDLKGRSLAATGGCWCRS
jgi:hypothetical protein